LVKSSLTAWHFVLPFGNKPVSLNPQNTAQNIMENFIVSARKYRPATFSTVVGQPSITTTLKNAIRNNQLAQAFLFCGPRGVGKTTCARILAKTINCQQLTEDIEACNQCPSCLSFNTSASFNIHELDAASNNSVDDIRSLIDQVRIPPQAVRYKVYIIDEVHMLSQAAFNAFLKTLEEPPAYAKFILATTEKHKIIPTVLSRCQIYDFKRITVEDIMRQLEFVARSESVIAEPDALHIIAQKADGAMRDALSIFDQLVSFSGRNITYQQVIDNLNVLDYDYYFRITDCLLENKMPESMMLIDEIINGGFDGQHFITGMSEHLRNLLICKDVITLKLLEVSDSLKERYQRQAARCEAGFLLKSLDIVNRCDIDYRASNNKRLHIELAILKMGSLIHPGPVRPVAAALAPVSEAAKKESQAMPRYQTPLQPQSTVSEPASETKPAPAAPKPATEKPRMPTTGISIAASLKKDESKASEAKNDTEETSENEGSPDEETGSPITNLQLEKAWEAFARSVAAKSPNLHATLTQSKPKLVDEANSVINFTIHSQLQLKEITDHKTELLSYLREQLENQKISIKTEMAESYQDNTPYTPTEKFKKMAEKNPNLIKLKDKLSLELDF
jgi:DNA polymerase III subunit gamma/tau